MLCEMSEDGCLLLVGIAHGSRGSTAEGARVLKWWNDQSFQGSGSLKLQGQRRGIYQRRALRRGGRAATWEKKTECKWQSADSPLQKKLRDELDSEGFWWQSSPGRRMSPKQTWRFF